MSHDLPRREFLRDLSRAAAAGLILPGSLAAAGAEAGRIGRRFAGRQSAPVRVRGRVVSDGRGVAGARVSDGFQVVRADPEGRFELVADGAARWIHLSTPSGYEIPVSTTGTAALHRPIEADGRGEMEALFRLSPDRRDQTDHAFLVLADPQTETDEEMARFHAETVPDVRRTIAGLDRPVFGVADGDIMYDDLALYPAYERAVDRMGVPFFQVVGNHDLDFGARSDDGSTATFERHFGPAYYSFDRGEVHYVVLDDVLWHGAGYIGYVDERQLRWLEADLAALEPGSTVVAFLHIPVLGGRHVRGGRDRPGTSVSVTNRDALYRLLEPFEAHVLTGHTHELEHVFEHGVHECVSGAVCGAWWSGDICYDGTPNGYGVYEVQGSDLRWRYKATGHPAEHQVRVYREADSVIANVWDWDPAWRVVWYEGGDRRGAMRRYTGLDPASVAQHAGEAVPAHRPWVEPVPTDHLFRAEGAEGPVTVEARDRFGRIYTASVGA